MKKSNAYSIPLFWMLASLAILAIVLAIYFVFTVTSGLNSEATKEKYSNGGGSDSTGDSTGDSDNIRFMTYKDTANFLAKDNDGYVRNLTELDLHARNVKTHIDYLNNIDDTTVSFTEDEKRLLVKCANNADKYLKDEKFADIKYGKHLDGKQIAGIKWVFANTFANYSKDVIKEYEQGLPHTRENIILLSKNVLKEHELDLTSTLIHEKIHIYQRYNPELFDKIIKEMGLKEIEKKSFRHAKYIRSNPDTNNKLYYYPKADATDATTMAVTTTGAATATTATTASDVWNTMTGSGGGSSGNASDTKDYDEDKVMVCLYRNDKPNSINDVKHKNFAEEHPYEKIAYEVAENYNNKNNNKNKNKYINI
jgi:hypothetical protein